MLRPRKLGTGSVCLFFVLVRAAPTRAIDPSAIDDGSAASPPASSLQSGVMFGLCRGALGFYDSRASQRNNCSLGVGKLHSGDKLSLTDR